MKKPLQFAVIIFFLFSSKSFAQHCTVSTGTATLDVNNVEAVLQASGDFWWDRAKGGYIVPKPLSGEPRVSSISAAGLWLGGVDPGGNHKITAQTYGAANGKPEWWPGPVPINTGVSNASICTNFDRLWKVEKDDIVAHIADYGDNGIINGPVPLSILSWPGRNNPSSLSTNGFVLPDQPLAPYADLNLNGIYDPLNGDYPLVPGDQAIWWVFNDEGGGVIHGETNGVPLRTEIHALAYAFAGTNDENLFNTTFYDFTIINRAQEDSDSCFVSLWVDVGLGCPYDDYIGCIPSEKMVFFYNQDPIDGMPDNTCDSFLTYNDNIPILAIKVLRGPIGKDGEDKGLSSFIYFVDSTESDPTPPSALTSPTTLPPNTEHYRFINGKWRDGTLMTVGGDGYDPTSSNYTSYVFPDNPNDPNGWSQCTVDLPKYDRRVNINSGPFYLKPGEQTSICYAVMSYFGAELPCPDIAPLIEMGNSIEAFCQSLSVPVKYMPSQYSALDFSPNPMRNEGIFQVKNKEESINKLSLYYLDGRLAKEYKNIHGTELTIQRNGLPSGIYIYEANMQRGGTAVGKIVFQ